MSTFIWILILILGVPWLYVAARVVTRGILRTINESKRK